MAAAGSGLELKLHPLVLVNVSDHYTRGRCLAAEGTAPPRQLGLLLGVQSGRTLEISNSFELSTTPGDPPTIDAGYLTEKQGQYKQVFPKLEVVGWYSTDESKELRPAADMVVHKRVMDVTESPVFLSFGGVIAAGAKDLPIALYESELRVVDGTPSVAFVEAGYTIETVEAERISVDNITKILPSGEQAGGAGELTHHMLGMHSAVKMLVQRVHVLHAYLQAVEAGQQPYDHALVRQIGGLLKQLPTMDSHAFTQDFNVETNDTLLMTYLASVTTAAASANSFVDKFSVVAEKAMGRRRGGAFGGGF